MRVINHDPKTLLGEQFQLQRHDGVTRTVLVNRFGWVITPDGLPVPHPEVDEIVTAIIAHEAAR